MSPYQLRRVSFCSSMGYGGVVVWCGVVQVALDNGLNVIACVGESLEVREANKTLEASAHLSAIDYTVLLLYIMYYY